ncbi:MAG: hypothetical protein DHS20C05_12510 [Hyphococcus sp.]|nr:MAG: hypothetical protein DHS20C05_12510 [Marinicaulis sp.]
MKMFFTVALISLGGALFGCSPEQSSTEVKTEPPLVEPSAQLEKLSGFAGEYVIVDARRASDVAAPAAPGSETPIGKSINFTQHGVEMEGIACEDWLIIPARVPVVYVDSDPNLTDLTLAPTDSPLTSGDQQVHAGFTVLCEKQRVMKLHRVDDRVLVMPWANSTVNLILERPLSTIQIKAYQAQLKSMKFYDGALTGELDEATLRASRAWYEHRAMLDDTQPIPARPAITENLLDALRVIEP